MSKGFSWKLAWSNLKKNRRIYVPFLISSTGIAIMFYILNALSSGIDQEKMFGGGTVFFTLNLGVVVIGLFAVLFLFYTNSFIMKQRKKELGLYNILGMEKRHIAKIVLCETLLLCGITILLGVGLGIVLSKLMFLILGKILQVTVPIAFVIPPSAILVTALLFLGIFLLTLLYNLVQIRLANPIALLHGGDMGEKEPKARWILAVLGTILLGLGYYIACTIPSPVEAIAFFFLAVLLVILGTYLLFITGITAMLKLMKKNKGYYYKSRHFTTVSGMLYRMKANAAGLASICILFTALLVTVSTTFSLYVSTEELVEERYPRNIAFEATLPTGEAVQFFDEVLPQQAEAKGFTPLNVVRTRSYSYVASLQDNQFTVLSGDMGNLPTGYVSLSAITLEEYRKISGSQEMLDADQVLLADSRNTFPQADSLIIDGRSFSLKRTDYTLATGQDAASVFNTYYLIFPDAKTITDTFSNASNAERMAVPQYYYAYDIDGTPEEIMALREAISSQLYLFFTQEEGNGTVDYYSLEDSATSRQDIYGLYGGLFFVGMFLGLLFLLGTALIIYYKQVSEGYEDTKRFSIMQKVGMSHAEVKKTIHSQILTVFFLPLLTAVIHLAFAFPMLRMILSIFNLTNLPLILLSTGGCVVVFALAYATIYAITARTYYKIVEQQS